MDIADTISVSSKKPIQQEENEQEDRIRTADNNNLREELEQDRGRDGNGEGEKEEQESSKQEQKERSVNMSASFKPEKREPVNNVSTANIGSEVPKLSQNAQKLRDLEDKMSVIEV